MKTLEVSLRQELRAMIISHYELDGRPWGHQISKWAIEYITGNSSVISRVNMYIMTHLFNRGYSFFVVCTEDNHPIGFIKLIRKEMKLKLLLSSVIEKVVMVLVQSNLPRFKSSIFEWRI